MSRHHLKPEQRNLRQDLAFARNARSQHMIECRNAIRCHQQKSIVYCIEIAYFTAPKQRRRT